MKIKIMIILILQLFICVIGYSQDKTIWSNRAIISTQEVPEKDWGFMLKNAGISTNIELAADETLPISIDWTTSKYFPPISSQLEGACTSWALVYYMKTFSEAREHDWDLSGALWEDDGPSEEYQSMIASPFFVYHQTNYGRNGPSTPDEAMRVLCDIGVCSWRSMGYIPEDPTHWPSEEAWREAPLWRCESYSTISMSDYDAVQQAKNFLSMGILLSFSVNGAYTYGMTTLDNYPDGDTWGHHVTIAGFDDNKSYSEQGEVRYGAFKVVNSFGSTWGENGDGCFWISYNALRERASLLYYFIDKENYIPTVLGRINIKHSKRGECSFIFSLCNNNELVMTKEFFKIEEFTNNSFPDNDILIDLTEFADCIEDGSSNFLLEVDDRGSVTTGVIQHFSIEIYDDYYEPPTHNLVSEDIPCETQHYSSVIMTIKPIQVKYPNEAEELSVGDEINIEWDCLNIDNIIIEYATDLFSWTEIATVDASLKQYNWTVPDEPSTICRLRISDITDPGYYDESDNVFEITGDRSLQVISPNGGEDLLMGKDTTIQWQRTNYDDNVTIYLIKPDTTVETIATVVPGDTYLWQPQYQISGSEYEIAVAAVKGWPLDISDNNFTLSSPVVLTSLIEGQEWLKGTTPDIVWEKGTYEGPVNIYLMRGDNIVETIAIQATGTHCTWLVPEDIEDGYDYYILLESSDQKYADKSMDFIISSVVTKWIFSPGGPVYGTAAIRDSAIYIGSHNHNIYAINPNGEELWKFQTNCFIYGSPAVDDGGNIYIGNNQTSPDWVNFFAINSNGLEEWSTHIGTDTNWGMSINAVALGKDEKLFAVVPYDRHLYCLGKNSERNWSFLLDEGPECYGIVTPAVGYDGTIYVGDRGGNIYAVNPDGSQKWKVQILGWVLSGPIIGSDGTLYVCSSDEIAAVSYNGVIKWSVNLDLRAYHPPSIGKDGTIYICVYYDSTIYALYPDGSVKWAVQLEDQPYSSPTIGASGTIYISTKKQSLVAINPDGIIMWEYPIGPSVLEETDRNGSSPTIDDDGIIYIGGSSDNLYALRTNYETGLADTPWPKIHRDIRNSSYASVFISLNSLNGGDEIMRGESAEITWSTSSNIDAIKIEYSIDNGQSWHIINQLTENDGTYQWQVPNLDNSYDDCRVKISIPGRQAFYDISDYCFCIM